MTKGLALKDYVEIDGSDLSNDCRSVNPADEHNQVDVSGFNPTGRDEFLLGTRVQSVTCEFFLTDDVFDTIYPPYRDRTPVTFKWRKDMTAVVSATNPELQGNVLPRTWPPNATRGDVRVISVEFIPSDSTGLEYSAT